MNTFEYKGAKVSYKDWPMNNPKGLVFQIAYPKYLKDFNNLHLNLHMEVYDSGWVGQAKPKAELTAVDFLASEKWAKKNIDGTLSLYQRMLRRSGSTRGLAIELHDGIYAVKEGNKSKWYKISPYQYNSKTFQADEVKQLGQVYETSGLGTLFYEIPIGFTKILIGIGDD